MPQNTLFSGKIDASLICGVTRKPYEPVNHRRWSLYSTTPLNKVIKTTFGPQRQHHTDSMTRSLLYVALEARVRVNVPTSLSETMTQILGELCVIW